MKDEFTDVKRGLKLMGKDSGEYYVANIVTADGAVPLGCQSAFWMSCFKDGRIVMFVG